MNIGQAIYYKLKTASTVIGYTSQRIYPQVSPQGAKWPHITYNIISNPPIHAMGQDANLYRPRVGIHLWSTSYTQCRALAKAVENTLRDFTGVISSGANGATVQRSFYESEGEITEVDPVTKAVSHHIFQDYIVWYTTST